VAHKTDKSSKTPYSGKAAKAATHETAFPVVAVGASAGGLEAFTKLLQNLPVDTGMAFVLVQHLDPKHVSLLPGLLSRATAMPVAEVKDGMRLEPNHIYVLPPNYGLALLHGVLHLLPRDEHGKHLPIDDFMHSLADDQKNNAIGVVLSGTASDGTLGLKDIKAAGGITFAQSEESAEYGGMPHSAIAVGHVDFILTPEGIAEKLTRLAHHPYLLPEMLDQQESMLAESGDNLSKIFILLRAHTGNDFTYYKHSTLQRRIHRRMVLHQLERMEDYIKLLQKQPAELDALFQDILINVTSFFRDPETFEALKKEVFPRLAEKRAGDLPLRIWVPGCSTGEEPYSLAIALMEFLGDRAPGVAVQIFATDIDGKAVDKARQGIYPQSIVEDVSPQRLQRFFIKTTAGYQISKAIRDMCIFALQNVIKDPPFSKLDLILCRNLMIYLGSMLQQKVLHTFHYALRPNGFLMLGTSETTGALADLFALVDKKSKIYIKKTTALRASYDFTAPPHSISPLDAEKPAPVRGPSALDIQHEAECAILDAYSPPGVIINQEMQILQFRGQTGPYIEPAPGSASLNLLKMARQDLALELREMLHQAIDSKATVRKENIHTRHGGGSQTLNLQVIPLQGTEIAEHCFLVLFEPVSDVQGEKRKSDGPAVSATPDPRDLKIHELESELLTSRQYLQSIIEEQETTNQELQSANEEIQSANEELQSTNEELETAKEELQSTNEELATINEEHEMHNQELIRANNDLTNLLASVDLAVLILSEDLRIRRFTPKAKTLLNLIDTDIDRPIGHIRPNVNVPDLEKRALEVIDTMSPQFLEVQDNQGRWYELRIRPYKTMGHRIQGVVAVFIDITERKIED